MKTLLNRVHHLPSLPYTGDLQTSLLIMCAGQISLWFRIFSFTGIFCVSFFKTSHGPNTHPLEPNWNSIKKKKKSPKISPLIFPGSLTPSKTEGGIPQRVLLFDFSFPCSPQRSGNIAAWRSECVLHTQGPMVGQGELHSSCLPPALSRTIRTHHSSPWNADRLHKGETQSHHLGSFASCCSTRKVPTRRPHRQLGHTCTDLSSAGLPCPLQAEWELVLSMLLL